MVPPITLFPSSLLWILSGGLVILFVVVMFVVALTQGASENEVKEEKAKYKYKRKNFFLSRAENECFDALMAAVGNDYIIFAQVHLPTLVEHNVPGQNWQAAFRHINGKSVDFVLCDKVYVSPKLAIELDDKTHERTDRQERDTEVERILKEAGVPLLRLQNCGSFEPRDLARKIHAALK